MKNVRWVLSLRSGVERKKKVRGGTFLGMMEWVCWWLMERRIGGNVIRNIGRWCWGGNRLAEPFWDRERDGINIPSLSFCV